ncbi:MAG: histidine kinase [Burkholderiaceae bacterium]
MRIDWIEKLRHLLQVWAFALVIATVQYAFLPERPYGPVVAHSVFIATLTWAIIDLGRDFMPSSAETGWPHGWQGFALVAGAIVAGFVIGTFLADRFCQFYRLYPPGAPPIEPVAQLRNGILITLVAGIVVTYYFYSINKSAYLERKMDEARTLANESRLKLLETQLEPHMLFNTLANLRALIGTDPPRAQAMLDHMIAYLRATLKASRSPAHSLEAEFARLRDYLELMAVRMGPRLAYTLDLPADLAARPVPTLLLQPLVENSIKHGLEPKVGGGRIDVRARSEEGELVLEVADTGMGMGAGAMPQSGEGFGLSQVRERLATAYGARGRLDFAAAAGQGIRVTVFLPMQP